VQLLDSALKMTNTIMSIHIDVVSSFAEKVETNSYKDIGYGVMARLFIPIVLRALHTRELAC
jgi:hypothetical protein